MIAPDLIGMGDSAKLPGESDDRYRFVEHRRHLGEILELDHNTAAETLDTSPAAFRKRLQRARSNITNLMRQRCGLYDPANPCRCKARIPVAIEQGRLDPDELLFASSVEQARRFPVVLEEIRRIDAADRAAALYRSHPDTHPKADLVAFVRELFPAS